MEKYKPRQVILDSVVYEAMLAEIRESESRWQEGLKKLEEGTHVYLRAPATPNMPYGMEALVTREEFDKKNKGNWSPKK